MTCRPSYTSFLLAFALGSTAALGSEATATDWPGLRGPGLDGRAGETSLFGAEFGLETVWKHPLGPAYSSVSVAAGKAVTLFSDGERDVAVAFDAATGKELWRRAFADTYRGHDGSSDGPVGTPTVDGERVYFVAPRGGLYALDLAGGAEIWSRDLVAEFGAEAPLYGFSATPVVLGDLLIVDAGGAGRAVVALDKRTGELRWTAGDDPVTHSSPVLTEVDGGRVLISSGSTRLTALRPADGKVLWSHEHSAEPPFDPTYPQALAFGRDKILLTFENEAVLYRLADGGSGLDEVWRSRGFKKSSAVPVAHGGHLYGFSGRFLTCLDAADGRVVWKSRPPGGRGLILVDGHLLVLGSEGWLTAVEATPEGYREKARIQVSDQGGYTAPSFAGGRIYVRNLADVAAVRVVGGGAAAGRREAAGAAAGDFAAWVREVEAAPAAKRGLMIDDFLAAQDGFPVVEGERRAHFVYRGPAEAVSVVGQMQADGAVPEPLARIAGTDFFYRSYELEPEARWHYRFQVDFDDPAPDPLNPNRALGDRDEASELVMPGFRDPAHVEPVADPSRAGRLEDLELESEAYGRTVTVRVYLPAGYDHAGTDAYPLLILPNGEQWLAAGLKNTLDHVLGERARPAVVAFVPMAGWVGGSWGERARRLLGDELLPRLDAAYRLDGAPGAAALWTVQEKAAIALDLIAARPERFGRVALQSPYTYRGELPSLEAAGDRDLRFFVSWSRYELRSAELGYDEAGEARDLRRRLAAAGFEVWGGEFAAGPGFRTWRQAAEDVLGFLLPVAGD